MDILGILWILAQAVIVFAASTLLFDVLHYLLHRWQNSRFAILREFSRWHNVHHDFLDTNMDVHPELVKENFWYHLLPEYATSLGGTLVFAFFFDWWAIALVAAVHTVLFALRIKEEGRDVNHMSMDRLDGQRGFWFVSPSYHALHHIHPRSYYASFLNVFDLLAGTNCQIKGRKFLVTGAGGAYGSAMVNRLEKLGGIVDTAKSGQDYSAGDYDRIVARLQWADVVILAHGSKTLDCWNANYHTFVDLIDRVEELGKSRLTPPEVWAVGSEVELHGDLGMDALKDYAASKRAFAARARDYYRSPNLMYRHIVPSAFTSPMGRGLISAETAVSISLFLIMRGFNYVPVTYTTLAFWNYVPFRFGRRKEMADIPQPAE